MKKITVILLTILLAQFLKGQNDPEAVRILDKFSSVAQAAPSVSLKFRMISVNQAENMNDTVSGSIIMTRNMYRLELPGNITWFNGSVSWNYLIPEKEVTITRPDRKDDSFMSKPSAIFTLYKEGYKARLLEEDSRSYVVDLYPEDIKSELIRIRLSVSKSSSSLLGAEYRRKDGLVVYLVVDEYNLKASYEQSFFTFNPKEYRGVEVIDMR